MDNTLRRRSPIEAGDSNPADAFDPAIEWNGFAVDTFDGLGSHSIGDEAPFVSATTPGSGATDVASGTNVEITFSEAVDVTGSWFSISCGTSGAHTASVSGGPQSFTLNPDSDFATSETCTVTVFASQVTDQDASDPPDNMAGNHAFTFTTVLAVTPIHEIQGASHRSPKAGMAVKTQAIVTAVGSNGFWMQEPDAEADADPATSEAIFVFTSSAPTVAVGDSVEVTGNVSEFRPGGSSSTNLTTSEIVSPAITVLSSGNGLPAPTVIGSGGRTPPSEVIEDDAAGSVETSGSFDPAQDGIDFYESLEAMRVQVNNPVAASARTSFGEIAVLADDGADASVRTPRGGIVVRSGDFNPERIILDDVLSSTPTVNTGDHFSGAALGVLDYSFGNFKLLPTSALSGVSSGLARETVAPAGTGEISFATFNVENLDPTDGAAKFAELAGLIVDNLASPDLLSLEEVQDDNGPTNDSVVDAATTYNTLIAAIQAEDGPTYEFRQINPVDDQDGGEPGGNIRVGFLFRTDRGLSFVDRPGGGSTTATTVQDNGGVPELSASPGRIDPTNSAFTNSRKPLAGEFTYAGRTLFLIANHWNSKGGDEPLFGRFQPPTLSSEVQRNQQAQVVNNFVDAILAIDANASIAVLGDLNDFDFSTPLATVKGGVLANLVETLPQSERYSFVFDGNAQILDHILLSNGLFAKPFSFDIAHVNAEFATQASDHDPLVAQLCADGTAPSLSVSVSPSTLTPPNHKYRTVNATVGVSDDVDASPSLTLVSVTSNEPDDAPGGADGNTTNDIVIVDQDTFRLRAERSETGTGRIYTITYQATDACGNSTTKSVTVTVPLRA
jgi:predicted extracellular nuclease